MQQPARLSTIRRYGTRAGTGTEPHPLIAINERKRDTMNIKPLVDVAIAGLVAELAGNALQKGPTKDADFDSKKNVVQYGIIGGTAAGIGFLAPGMLGATTGASGALRGAAFGAAMLGGWAVGELASKQLGW